MYFCLIVVVMLYLCMVLIGRRHWMGGRDGRSMLGHYLLRFVVPGRGGGVARSWSSKRSISATT